MMGSIGKLYEASQKHENTIDKIHLTSMVPELPFFSIDEMQAA